MLPSIANGGIRPPKTREEEEKCVASAMPRKRTCASSLLNAGVDSKLVRLGTGNFKRHCHFRSEVYSMVKSEPKEREFKNRKISTLSFLES